VVLHGRVDRRLTTRDRLQRLADLLGAGVLGQVAAGAGAQRLHDRALVVVGRERDHLDPRVALAQAPGRRDPVDARHAQVHEDGVGSQLGGDCDGLLAVGRGADDLDAGQQPEQHHQALAHDALVVGDQHPDHRDPPAGLLRDRPAHAGTQSSTRKPVSVGAAASVPPRQRRAASPPAGRDERPERE
jgi:hypothetical protein